MSKSIEIPDFKKIAEDALKDLPQDVAERARAFFLSSFHKQGFTDTSFIPWVKRSNTALSHKILSNSLALRNSVKIKQATLKCIEISAGEGLPYAAIHNNGGTITVRVTDKMKKYFWAMFYKTGDAYWQNAALTTKTNFVIQIPKRQFIGESDTLNKNIDTWATTRIKQAEKRL